ncbi:MAG: hypothetical protein U0S50_16690 [Sphingopyxis sp.]|uniref:hypothetical protein n=1 Tax=Sphingopyxis sp. TaxID=1908224 RepID=UPI002ABCE7EF|nr:hypothetical protein [Sphingopyxis sp.]MDZ3833432.1 hypothetical protein [Sphingopyxis sp.]
MRHAALFIFLFLGACVTREGKPTETEIDQVEAQLEGAPCVGRLADWERIYAYRPEYFAEEVHAALKERREPRPSGYDRSIIDIHLRPANVSGSGAGRKSQAGRPAEASADNPDKDHSVRGSFDLRRGQLAMKECGAV